MSTPIRLRPGIVAVTLQWLFWFVAPLIAPEKTLWFMGLSALSGLAVLLWWMFLSRVPHAQRWGAFGVIAAIGIATRFLLDPSISGGMMGMMFPMYAFPFVTMSLVTAAAAGARWPAVIVSVVVAFLAWPLLRTEGMTGEGHSQLALRWAKTPEQELLARAEPAPAAEPKPAAQAPVLPSPTPAAAAMETSKPEAKSTRKSEWPGFRGAQRDGRVSGVTIKTDWTASPPVEMWRRPVGPGWSSFAIGDGLLYTQEQRGDSEVVACYEVATGKPVWNHRTNARFWESNAGAGPRGTPTLHEGRVYAVGATGILNALDAATGSLLWTRNTATDTEAKLPDWGFSSSPLVWKDTIIVAASGYMAAYEAASGKLRWKTESIGGSYSSPHLVSVDGVEQVVMLGGTGAGGYAPADGKVLWQHEWKGFPMLQPAMADRDILITTATAGGGSGTRRVAIAHEGSGWAAKEVWTSNGLKPYFNDLVVHKGHAFGFDGAILSCIDLSDGKRKWKGGRYGHGQMVLLADQDLLLVLSEEGEVALVSATADEFREVAKIPALHDKTWNHPAVVRDTLLVRNGEEMVAFRLPRQ